MIDPSATIHSHALIEKDVVIGANTRVWAFAHILPGVNIGANCNICDHTLIENGVTLGDRVTVKSGVYIWTGVIVENDVFIGPCVAFTNDKRPRSQQHLAEYPKTLLQEGCSIGANATILPGVTLGKWSMIGAGSVVTKDVPAHALVFGNPARIQGWICYCGERLRMIESEASCLCGKKYHLDREIIREIK
ncbi:MAG TPA: acyltransferase [Gammaproteobacteria bacterium]|nr:acyltransferase [Gammaproteobacteria bacterium]